MCMQVDVLSPEGEMRNFANSLWAIASLGLSLPQKLLYNLSERWAERILELRKQEARSDTWAQHTSNILWAYAQLRLDPLQGR